MLLGHRVDRCHRVRPRGRVVSAQAVSGVLTGGRVEQCRVCQKCRVSGCVEQCVTVCRETRAQACAGVSYFAGCVVSGQGLISIIV